MQFFEHVWVAKAYTCAMQISCMKYGWRAGFWLRPVADLNFGRWQVLTGDHAPALRGFCALHAQNKSCSVQNFGDGAAASRLG
jgi:hypothetical protein